MQSLRNQYFPQIDGLRALAVLIVTLFHYHVPLFGGGYIGVDIFFVISGFLITSILFEKHSKDDFSFFSFYKKRFYRLYPALLFVCILTFILACILFSPSHLENASMNLLGALTFTSNFVYWKSVSYFQVLSLYDPFVPTWSLGIEMQYYLLFPIFFIPVLKYLRNYSAAVILICSLLSLILAEIFLRITNNFVYYNLPFRFFEFGIGALCFYWLKQDRQGYPFLASLGLFFILIGMVFINNQTPFPGLWALLPCIGAALVITSSSVNDVGHKLLSNRGIVYLGKISYSFYLIHWPAYVLFSYWYFDELTIFHKVGLIVFSAALASFTYHFVENSYRHQKIGHTKISILVLCMSLTLIFSYLCYIQKGWAWRLNDEQKTLQFMITEEDEAFKKIFDNKFPLKGESEFIPDKHSGLECSFNNTKDYKLLLPCLAHNLQQQDTKGFLLIGDSNGANTYRALKIAYPNTSFAMLQQAGCAATQYLEDKRSGSWCFKDLDKILNTLNEKRLVKGVILTSRWTLQPYGNIKGNARNYSGPVMIIGPTPMLRHDTFETLFMSRVDDYYNLPPLEIDGVAFQKDFTLAENFLSSLQWARYVSKAGLLCDGGECPVFIGSPKRPLFLDDQHLSSAGIEYFAQKLKNSPEMQNFIYESDE